MNTHSAWNDAQVHAYVDGELDAQSAAQLEADGRADASLAARVARQRRLRQALQAGFDSVLDEPVPQRLRNAMVAAPKAEVIALDATRGAREPARRTGWSPREWGTIAATLVLGTLLGAALFRNTGGLPVETVQGQLVARSALDIALSTQLSGSEPAGAAARIGLSFRATDGAYCRTFNLPSGAAGLACRRQGRWAVQLLDDSSVGHNSTDGFRQASSPLSPALLGAINALGAGDALTREQEQQQLRSGWESAPP